MWSHDKRECVQSDDNRSPRAMASEVTLTGHEEADVMSKKGTLSSLWNTCVQSDNDCWTHSGHLKEEMHHASVCQSLMAAALTSTWQVPCDLFYPTCLLYCALLSSQTQKCQKMLMFFKRDRRCCRPAFLRKTSKLISSVPLANWKPLDVQLDS